MPVDGVMSRGDKLQIRLDCEAREAKKPPGDGTLIADITSSGPSASFSGDTILSMLRPNSCISLRCTGEAVIEQSNSTWFDPVDNCCRVFMAAGCSWIGGPQSPSVSSCDRVSGVDGLVIPAICLEVRLPSRDGVVHCRTSRFSLAASLVKAAGERGHSSDDESGIEELADFRSFCTVGQALGEGMTRDGRCSRFQLAFVRICLMELEIFRGTTSESEESYRSSKSVGEELVLSLRDEPEWEDGEDDDVEGDGEFTIVEVFAFGVGK